MTESRGRDRSRSRAPRAAYYWTDDIHRCISRPYLQPQRSAASLRCQRSETGLFTRQDFLPQCHDTTYVQAVLYDSYRRFRRLSILLHANPTVPRNEEILSPNRVCQPEAASFTDANISAPTPQESSSAHMNRLELDVDPPPALFALKAGKVAGRPAGEETKESVKVTLPSCTCYLQSCMRNASTRLRNSSPRCREQQRNTHPSLTSETIATASDKDGHARTS